MVRDAATKNFKFNHTMYRVKDYKKSLDFYQRILGMDLIDEMKGPDFTLFFLGYDHSDGADTAEEKTSGRRNREGLLELTYNHGTETDPNFKGYATGNSEPRGYGHIAITVDDVHEACKRFDELGVKFQKRPEEGKMKYIAFILDPDGYWVEIVPNKPH